jgi:spermidine synthase
MAQPDDAEILDRSTTSRGELLLRRVGTHLEVISNGVFLMDTRDGRSERALVREALALHGSARSLLVGGLGVGLSLLEAVAHAQLQHIVVVEIEQRLVEWHATHLAGITGDAMTDPRVEVVVSDLRRHLAAESNRYDVLCLDVDNGPDWTVTEDNAGLYGPDGVALMLDTLAPRGVLAVWSANTSPGYELLLREHLDDVRVVEIDARAPRGEPDVVYLGRRR